MRVLKSDPGRSTIDNNNALSDADGSPVQIIEVPVQRFNDLHLDHIGLVKVDVEGHELAALRGAADTLTRNRPTVLVARLASETAHNREPDCHAWPAWGVSRAQAP